MNDTLKHWRSWYGISRPLLEGAYPFLISFLVVLLGRSCILGRASQLQRRFSALDLLLEADRRNPFPFFREDSYVSMCYFSACLLQKCEFLKDNFFSHIFFHVSHYNTHCCIALVILTPKPVEMKWNEKIFHTSNVHTFNPTLVKMLHQNALPGARIIF